MGKSLTMNKSLRTMKNSEGVRSQDFIAPCGANATLDEKKFLSHHCDEKKISHSELIQFLSFGLIRALFLNFSIRRSRNFHVS